MPDNKLLRFHVSTLWFFLIVMWLTMGFLVILLEKFNHRINHVEAVVQELIDELAPRLREGALDHET